MHGHNLITDPENTENGAKQPAKAMVTVTGFIKAGICVLTLRDKRQEGALISCGQI